MIDHSNVIEPLRVPFIFDTEEKEILKIFGLSDSETKEIEEFLKKKMTPAQFMEKVNEYNKQAKLSINQYMYLTFLLGVGARYI